MRLTNTCDFPVEVTTVRSTDTSLAVDTAMPFALAARSTRQLDLSVSSPDGGVRLAAMELTLRDGSRVDLPVQLDAPEREHVRWSQMLAPAVDVVVARDAEFSAAEVAALLRYGHEWYAGERFYRFHFVGSTVTHLDATEEDFSNKFLAALEALEAVDDPLHAVWSARDALGLQRATVTALFVFANPDTDSAVNVPELFAALDTGGPLPPFAHLFVRNESCPATLSATWQASTTNAEFLEVCARDASRALLSARLNDWSAPTVWYFEGNEFLPSFRVAYDGEPSQAWVISSSANGTFFTLKPPGAPRFATVEYDLLSACEPQWQ